jgi:hypothetical protein
LAKQQEMSSDTFACFGFHTKVGLDGRIISTKKINNIASLSFIFVYCFDG